MRNASLALAVAFVLSGLAVQSLPIYAGGAWCSEDPILTFNNGMKLQLLAQYDSVYSPSVSAVAWFVQVPNNAGTIIVTAPTNAAHSEHVTLSYTGGSWDGGNNDIQIHATATVTSAYTFPLALSVNGDTSTSPIKGFSNKPLTIAAHTHASDFTAYQGITTGTSYAFTGTGSANLP
jgi:hypothetical protein